MHSLCGKQRLSGNPFEDKIAIAVPAELSENLGDRKTCFAQFAQDVGFVPEERIAVSSVPVRFPVPPSFFDYHPAHRQHGKVECFVNASFPALRFRFEDKKVAADQSAPVRIIRARFLEGVFQPVRNGLAPRAVVPAASSPWILDESGRAFDRTAQRAISVIDQALPAVLRVERDTRTGQPTGGAVKFVGQLHGFISRARINSQKFPNL